MTSSAKRAVNSTKSCTDSRACGLDGSARASPCGAGPTVTRDVEILGPAAAPMERRGGHYRAQLLARAVSHAPLQRLLAAWLPEIEALPEARRVRWSIDVDPVELF